MSDDYCEITVTDGLRVDADACLKITDESVLALRQRLAEMEAENTVLRKKVAALEWGNEMACENTPTPGCACPGCSLARERSLKNEVGP